LQVCARPASYLGYNDAVVSRRRALARTPFFAPESIAVKTIAVAWRHVWERKHDSLPEQGVASRRRFRTKPTTARQHARARNNSDDVTMTCQRRPRRGMTEEHAWSRVLTRADVVRYRLPNVIANDDMAMACRRAPPQRTTPLGFILTGKTTTLPGIQTGAHSDVAEPLTKRKDRNELKKQIGCQLQTAGGGKRQTLRNDFVRIGSILSTWTLLQAQQLQGNKRRGSSLRPLMAPPPWLCPLSAGTTHHHAPCCLGPQLQTWSNFWVFLCPQPATSCCERRWRHPHNARHDRTAKVKIMRPDSPGALFPWRGAPSVVLVGREIGRAAERRRRWSMEKHGEQCKNNNS
jgi:hypothetical protein